MIGQCGDDAVDVVYEDHTLSQPMTAELGKRFEGLDMNAAARKIV